MTFFLHAAVTVGREDPQTHKEPINPRPTHSRSGIRAARPHRSFGTYQPRTGPLVGTPFNPCGLV